MKLLIVALVLTAAPSFSSACPAGNLKSLSVNGQQLAEINMTDSSIRVTDSSSRIVGISTIYSNSYEPREQCGQEMNCESSELLAIDVNEDPKAVVTVAIRQANRASAHFFKVTDFYQSRDVNSCGQVVEPLQ